MKESISALLDGQVSASELDQLLADFERDPELRRQLSRQVLAREGGLMGTRVRRPDLDFADRVYAALQSDEPQVVVPFGQRVRRLPWRMAVSLAAAAGLGAVSVLAVRPAATPGMAPVVPQVAAVPAAAVVAEAQPVQTGYAELDDENARQLRNYLMAYSQSRGQQGVGSTLGYARYAAYTDDRPAAARPADLKR
jgi:negative regulator of sigma E activity